MEIECKLCKRECPPPLVEVGGRMVKNPNGHSRRHWTPAPFEAYQANKEARSLQSLNVMIENEKARAKRTAKQQLKLIAKRRGESQKEKTRLMAQLETAS